MFAAPEGMLPGGAPTPGGAKRGTAGPSSRNLKSCNCRNSRCLKLYCECFASGQYCFACNCQGCYNNPENNDKRMLAIQATLERCASCRAGLVPCGLLCRAGLVSSGAVVPIR